MQNWRSESVPWRNSSIMNNPSTVAWRGFFPPFAGTELREQSHSASSLVRLQTHPLKECLTHYHITPLPPPYLPTESSPHSPSPSSSTHSNLLSWKMKSPLPLDLFLALHSFVITLRLLECCQAFLGMQHPLFFGFLFSSYLTYFFYVWVQQKQIWSTYLTYTAERFLTRQQIKQL